MAKRYGINQKTVAKRKRRTSVADLPTGPKDARSTVLSAEEEAIIVAFRKHTLLPMDDYIERFYNAVRRHSTLGYVSPVEFERLAALA